MRGGVTPKTRDLFLDLYIWSKEVIGRAVPFIVHWFVFLYHQFLGGCKIVSFTHRCESIYETSLGVQGLMVEK